MRNVDPFAARQFKRSGTDLVIQNPVKGAESKPSRIPGDGAVFVCLEKSRSKYAIDFIEGNVGEIALFECVIVESHVQVPSGASSLLGPGGD